MRDVLFFPFACHLLCKVIFDETLQKCLDSYLCYAPRKFDALLDCHPDVNDMQKCLHRSVFLTFLRMSTHKESKVKIFLPCKCSGLDSLGKRQSEKLIMVLTCMSSCVSLPGYFYQAVSPYGGDASALSGYLNYAVISQGGDPGNQLSNSGLVTCGGMISCCRREKSKLALVRPCGTKALQAHSSRALTPSVPLPLAMQEAARIPVSP